MLRLILPTVLLTLWLPSFAAESTKSEVDELDEAFTKKVTAAYTELNTIGLGMTRADLLKVAEPDGGWSTRTNQTFCYKKCPMIKVSVQFEPVDKKDFPEDPRDKIVKISKPFLEWPRGD